MTELGQIYLFLGAIFGRLFSYQIPNP